MNANSNTRDFKRVCVGGKQVRAGRAVFQPQEQEPDKCLRGGPYAHQ